MQNGSGKYVPPPQRNVYDAGESQYQGHEIVYQQSVVYGVPAPDYNQQQRWSVDNREYGGGYQSRGYSQGGFRPQQQSFGGGRMNYGNNNGGGYYQNNPSYPSNQGQGYGNNNYSRGSGGYGRGGGYTDRQNSGGYNIGPKVNSMGFYGDERPNPTVEEKLFRRPDSQTAGINFDKYDDIPVEVSEGCPPPVEEFTEDAMGTQLYRNLKLSSFNRPTPVQKYSIPIGLMGADLMACAQTGSGKTGGFLFPVITILLRKGALTLSAPKISKASYPSALILAPTRELVSQIFDEAQKFCYCSGLRPVVIYGGTAIQDQQRELDRGVDILIATPGRLTDLIDRGRIKLDAIQFLVLDEADRMLDMGFEPQIRRIVQEEGMPRNRQTFMFSATFPIEIQRLAGDFLTDYIFVAVGSVGAPSKDVIQRVEWVEPDAKVNYVLDFLTNRQIDGLILVFVETKRGADLLEETLSRNNIPAISIHGDKSQSEREQALKLFKSGKKPVLVATDVAARGLDISNVTNVINFDLPSNLDDYIHRIGRTGRVGNVGYALSLFNDKNANIGRELAESLINNDQECPEWLESKYCHSNHGGGGRGRGGRGRGGQRFGAKDYRKDKKGPESFGGSTTGGRGGGSNSYPPSTAPVRSNNAAGYKGSTSNFPPLASTTPSGPPLPYHAPSSRQQQADNSDW